VGLGGIEPKRSAGRLRVKGLRGCGSGTVDTSSALFADSQRKMGWLNRTSCDSSDLAATSQSLQSSKKRNSLKICWNQPTFSESIHSKGRLFQGAPMR